MESVQTDSKRKSGTPPSAELGIHLMTLIGRGINRLKLTREQMLPWTNNNKRLDAWLEQLKGSEAPAHPAPCVTPSCVLTDTGCNLSHHSHTDVMSAAPWLRYADGDPADRPITKELMETLYTDSFDDELRKRQGQYPKKNVFKCVVSPEARWGSEILRDAFRLNGPDRYLVHAILARKVIWDFEAVMTILARIVHDPNDDPLGLTDLDEGAFFLVYTESPLDASGNPDILRIVKTVKWLRLSPQSRDMHLGKPYWSFRLFESLEETLLHPLSEGRVFVPKQGSMILFRNDPSPITKTKDEHRRYELHS